ncbi:MAG: hypothetical protein GVY26_08165 [Bacteroidetes bacterium]|jgi:hypothetical protein|nr:hypothetical protein [Bacteroidota bacterium]
MSTRKSLLIAILGLLAFILFLLLTGSPVLTAAIDPAGKFPAGTLLVWLGFVLLPLAVYLIVFSGPSAQDPRLNVFRMGLLIAFALSLLWGFAAYGLAGNWQYNFSGQAEQFVGSSQAGEYFWYLNYLTLGWPLFVLLLYAGYRALQ